MEDDYSVQMAFLELHGKLCVKWMKAIEMGDYAKAQALKKVIDWMQPQVDDFVSKLIP